MSRRAALLGLAAAVPLAVAAVVAYVRANDRPAAPTPAVPVPAAAAPAEAEEHWQVLALGDDRIGYARVRTEPLPGETGGPARLRTTTETKMTFKRFGQEIRLGVDLETTETADGDLLSYRYEMTNAPAEPVRSAGTVRDGRLVIESTVAGKTTTDARPWEAGLKSPAYQERLLREGGLKPGETRSFRVFIPELAQASDIAISAGETAEVTVPGAGRRTLRRATVTQSVLPTMPTTAWLDDAGALVMVESDLLGQRLRAYEVTREEALKELAGTELDLAVGTLIPAGPLDDPHGTRRVVYRIHVPGADAASLFATGDTQQVKAIDRETVEVTVTARTVDPAAKAGEAPPALREPSRVVQSDDARVAEHARRAAGEGLPAGAAAVAMERYVSERLTSKNFSTAFASAAEVAERLEGDCTEHAVLLAALLRARGVPSRVAVGLVYLPGQAKMGGHMWTEARLGDAWVPLDATLGRGGIGGGHLKVADSDLSDAAPLPVTAFAPLMSLGPETKIEVVAVER